MTIKDDFSSCVGSVLWVQRELYSEGRLVQVVIFVRSSICSGVTSPTSPLFRQSFPQIPSLVVLCRSSLPSSSWWVSDRPYGGVVVKDYVRDDYYGISSFQVVLKDTTTLLGSGRERSCHR